MALITHQIKQTNGKWARTHSGVGSLRWGREGEKGEGMGAYHPVRHGDGLGDGEPERAEADEAERGADEQHEPGREAVAEHAGDDAEVLADVVGDAEHGELPLVVAEHRLERRRVERERVRVSRRHLHPHRRRQPHPRRPRPGLHLHVAGRHLRAEIRLAGGAICLCRRARSLLLDVGDRERIHDSMAPATPIVKRLAHRLMLQIFNHLTGVFIGDEN